MGLSNGEVALYKLWNVKGGEPVRMISLADWGFEPETTGSVAELQWSPDNTAIAVLTLLCLACLLLDPAQRLESAPLQSQIHSASASLQDAESDVPGQGSPVPESHPALSCTEVLSVKSPDCIYGT